MEQQIIEIIVDERNQQVELFGTPMFPCKACYSDVNKFVTGDIPWHWHEEIEVIRVKSGSIHLYLDNCDFVLNEGDGVFINSNILHYIRAGTSEECILNSLVFNKNLISGVIQSVFEQNFVNPIVENNNLSGIAFYKNTSWGEEASNCIKNAFLQFEKSEFGYEILVREYLSHMWYIMLKNIQDLNLNKNNRNDLNSERIKNILSFVHKNYNKQITLNNISKVVNLSERECLRCFKNTLGISPIQYILKYKVSIAAKMLSETKDSITIISDTVGFDSPSYFSKIFKRFIGITPTQYRNKSK